MCWVAAKTPLRDQLHNSRNQTCRIRFLRAALSTPTHGVALYADSATMHVEPTGEMARCRNDEMWKFHVVKQMWTCGKLHHSRSQICQIRFLLAALSTPTHGVALYSDSATMHVETTGDMATCRNIKISCGEANMDMWKC